jgi:SAM-dependent methyltransferase
VENARPPVSTAAFWEQLYAGRNDGWEIGGAAPPLEAWLDAGGAFPKAPVRGGGSGGAVGGPRQVLMSEPARVAVPGCGRGHDARLLARRGYRVWAFDFAEAAVAEARRLATREGVSVVVERRDVFALDQDYRGFFDGVWEYTCFCAIDPARREEYARLIAAILSPGGILLACFYPMREGTDGPPFPVSRPEVERVLSPWFTILESGPPARSVERREGLEWLVRAERR